VQQKKIMTVALLVFLLLGVNTAMAATKIAFVETGQVLQKSPQVKAVKDKIKKEFARRDDQLVAEQKQLTKLQEKLLKDGSVMSEAERTRLERDVLSRRRKLKSSQAEFQEDLTLRQNEELGKLRKQIAEVIINVAKKNGYDIVLESGVIWADGKINITDKVIKALK
jgi:outer membrane protein